MHKWKIFFRLRNRRRNFKTNRRKNEPIMELMEGTKDGKKTKEEK